MCGRFYETFAFEDLELRYLERNPHPKWPVIKTALSVQNRYNICPTQKTFVLNVEEGRVGFREMRWGLVPSWAKTVKDADKYSMINAKAEEITEKRSYKGAFLKRRCIVPVSGFYEWKRGGDKKRPFAIHLKDNPIMSLAGIWEHWISPETGEIVDSFSLITIGANSFMRDIHDRMPVILDEKNEEGWLDPGNNDPKSLMSLLKPCPPTWLKAHEISPLVNSPRNSGPEVLIPL